jgi:hypothetical protein
MNAEEYYQPTKHTHAHDLLGLPTLITALVIIVNVCKVLLSV